MFYDQNENYEANTYFALSSMKPLSGILYHKHAEINKLQQRVRQIDINISSKMSMLFNIYKRIHHRVQYQMVDEDGVGKTVFD